jgi:hypothetical protein
MIVPIFYTNVSNLILYKFFIGCTQANTSISHQAGQIIMHIFTCKNFNLSISCIVIVLWTFDSGTVVFRHYQLHEVATLAILTDFMQLHSHGSTNFTKNLEGPFQILGSQRMSQSKFLTQDQKSRRDLWMSLLAGAFCSLQVNWHTFLYVRKRTAVTMLKYLAPSYKIQLFGCPDTQVSCTPVHTYCTLPMRNQQRYCHLLSYFIFGHTIL